VDRIEELKTRRRSLVQSLIAAEEGYGGSSWVAVAHAEAEVEAIDAEIEDLERYGCDDQG
jgi:hypothetical protein